jgi:hypothetical protein
LVWVSEFILHPHHIGGVMVSVSLEGILAESSWKVDQPEGVKQKSWLAIVLQEPNRSNTHYGFLRTWSVRSLFSP